MNFVSFDNAMIDPYQALGGKAPIFDIKVRAHKKSAFSRASQNELAKELYQLGLFNPQYAAQAEICMNMMEFEGKDEVIRKIKEGVASGSLNSRGGIL